VISTAQSNGMHTNWVFTNRLGGAGSLHDIGTASSHEDGHTFGLWHQADYIGSVLQGNGYSTNNNSGSIAPTMGVAYSAARPAWRLGDANINGTKGTQNDPLTILGNGGIGNFVNDGIGHSQPTASPLPLAGNSIDFNLAKGIIVPSNSAAPNPNGEGNYTTDFFSFATSGGVNTVNLVAGREAITPGVADPDPMLDGTLRILDSVGNILATANTASLGETLSLNLGAGNYYIEVSSAGGKAADTNGGVWDPASFYDMGSYFLTGTIVAVPEPTTIALFGVVLIACSVQYRRLRHQRQKALDQNLS
jgi:Bacterial pre-peptidase C-terminal domain/PEP-CTERM motif